MKTTMSIALVLWLAGFASAAGPGHSHTMTPEMRRQHNSMSVTSKQWTACKKSLEAEDFAAAGAALEGMQKAASALEEFELHKKKERYLEFQEQARSFKANLKKLAAAVKDKKDEEVQNLITTIDDGCQNCHEKFR